MPYTTILGGDMNERIKKLYQISIQSTMNYHNENSKLKQKELDEFCASKFAELLIRECADIATINQYSHYTAGHYVMKHFGVE